MAQINFLNTSGSSVTNPNSDQIALFSSGSSLFTKDSNGNITPIASGSGGAGVTGSVDIYQTGSLTKSNTAAINFAGSGVQVNTSGSEGVTVTITGGGGGGTSGTSGS